MYDTYFLSYLLTMEVRFLAGLLEAEAAVEPRSGASVAVAFGGCRDQLASSTEVMSRLGASCPDKMDNLGEIQNVADLQKTFAYYFRNGASAGLVCLFLPLLIHFSILVRQSGTHGRTIFTIRLSDRTSFNEN